VSLREETVHVAMMFAVADVARSAAFSRGRLGFEAREEQPGLALLGLGPMLLYLVADRRSPWRTPSGSTSWAPSAKRAGCWAARRAPPPAWG
jgi:hypothetical protein